jgi:ABC-type polysaccharide/polyol phosphate export permease
MLTAATAMTVRRGTSAIAIILTALMVGSGAYFPLGVLPGWLEELLRLNPMAQAINGMRQALLAGMSEGQLLRTVGLLAGASCCGIALGAVAFRGALRRERRRGTLGQY